MRIGSCYCRNRHCRLSGLAGEKARLRLDDWHRGAPRLRCLVCRQRVSARTGTAYAGIRTDELTYRYAATALAEGLALRATGRLFATDKDTLCRWLLLLSAHCQVVMRGSGSPSARCSNWCPLGMEGSGPCGTHASSFFG